LLGNAYAYLFPIDWPEPFGLTMAESMATGTPVVAYRAGSTPEIVIDGVTGFVCDSMREMLEAVEKVGDLDRRACREHVERLFAPDVMVRGYEDVYAGLVRSERAEPESLGMVGEDALFAAAAHRELPAGEAG
jgi:glycosyltransferase involved in cell wall biosynthesis